MQYRCFLDGKECLARLSGRARNYRVYRKSRKTRKPTTPPLATFSLGSCIFAAHPPIVLYVLSVVLSRGLAPQLFRFGFVGGPVGHPSCVLLCRLVLFCGLLVMLNLFNFVQFAHALHSSSKLVSALAQSQISASVRGE